MPVLWDGVRVHANPTLDPDYIDPIGDIPAPLSPNGASNIYYWHRNPGDQVMDATLQEVIDTGVSFEDTLPGQYIGECISVFHNPAHDYSAALLMWDAMNEGDSLNLTRHQNWVSSVMAAINVYAPNDKVTWGWVVSDDKPQLIALATDPNCDVLSLHCYWHRMGAVQSLLHNAAFIAGASPSPYNKPAIFTEIGFPGKGFSYQDAIRYCSTAPRYGTSGQIGVGFMPWALMIGFRDNFAVPAVQDNMPFINGTGLFYHNGQPRESDVIDKFVELAANSHGISTGLWGQTGSPALLAAKDPLDQYYVDPSKGGNFPLAFDDEATQDYFMANQWLYQVPGAWTWDGYKMMSGLLRELLGAGTWPLASSTLNLNPYTWLVTPSAPAPAGYTRYYTPPIGPWPPLTDLWAIHVNILFAQSVYDPDPASPWTQMIADLEQRYSLTPGTLHPEIPGPSHQPDRDILADGFLWPFAQAAGHFLIDR